MSSQVRCMILRTPVTFTFFWNACAVGGIAVERTVATFFSSKYERMGRGLAILIVITEV
ncbi:unnamed protein product [Anisakis simplex]|uniref:Secreted protein n=1 Tax=Anisakis simplex TaxID=6269 RepID=A0A0M3JM87_ANISI|nr:unnamed protein product [Anisakis simplex]